MNQYPAVPSVFRVNSSSSILLNDNHKLMKTTDDNVNFNCDFHLFNNATNNNDSEDSSYTLENNKATNLTTPLSPSVLVDGNQRIPVKIVKKISRERNSYLLWIGTPVAASFSVAVVIAALAGPQWLSTEEKIPNENYNGTVNTNLKDDGVYVTKYTKSSLWILCAGKGVDYHCSTIDYFPNEEYSPDPNDSTMAIPYAIIKSTPFFLVAGCILLISYALFMLATCSHQHSIHYFISGVLFIISGLLMLIGLIMYISIFKAEVGSKLRPKSALQPPLFIYKYGQSFFLYVIGFISTEFVGVLNVFLYITLEQIGNNKTMPCLNYTSMGTPDKSMMKGYHLKDLSYFDSRIPAFSCKKHSSLGTRENYEFSPIFSRRFFFEKSNNKCDVHSKNLTKSLNELYTEPAPAISPFDLPQEFPLTRSVSTTTDILANNCGLFGNTFSSVSSMQHQRGQQHHNQRSHHQKDLNSSSKDSLKQTITNGVCDMTKSILSKTKKEQKSKEDLIVSEFCKKSGRRIKPQNIYYIEDPGMDDENSVYIVDAHSNLNNRFLQDPSIRRSKSFQSNKLFESFDKNSYDQTCNNNYFANKFCNKSMYQSRTLPRDFLKRNNHFKEGLFGEGRRMSTNSAYMFNRSYNNRNLHVNKSFDMLNASHRDISSFDDEFSSLYPHWPKCIPTSPSAFSTHSHRHSTSGFHCRHNQDDLYHHQSHDQTSISPAISEDFGIFDLDEIEREKRKSHASLFEPSNFQFSHKYNYAKSTPV